MTRQIEEGDIKGRIIVLQDKFKEFEEFQRGWVEGGFWTCGYFNYTVLAYGASMPEFAVPSIASIQVHDQLSISNIISSNINTM